MRHAAPLRTGTLASSWTRRLVTSARGLGLEIVGVLAEVGIDPRALEDPHGRVRFDQHAETVARVAKRLDDPGIRIQIVLHGGPGGDHRDRARGMSKPGPWCGSQPE